MHTNEPYPLTVVQQQLLVMYYIFIAIVTITDIQQQHFYLHWYCKACV